MGIKLYHFTKLRHLSKILHTENLTLANPEKWDDENDNYSIKKYKDLKNIKTLLTLCFTTKKDVYHLWKISSGRCGVRIAFDQEELANKLKDENILFREVEYLFLNELKTHSNDPDIISKLPFLKRKAVFSYEKEWRAIYESSSDEEIKEIRIGLSLIKEIALSPWFRKEKFECMKKIIKRKIPTVHIERSGALMHPEWIQAINNIKV